MRDSLAGFVEWSEFQCPISSGYHVLKFSYTKNQTKSKGSDCVWIDDIQLPDGIIAQWQADSCETPDAPQVAVSDSQVVVSWNNAYHTEEILLFDDVEGHPYGAVNSPGTLGWRYIDGDGAPTAAKYVAVHCVSHDQYMFCLDDLSIHGRKTSGHLCNVYRDGMLIASGVTDSVYVDSLASAGEHCYSITYSCGDMESAHSDTACVHLNAAPTAVMPEERDALPYELPSESKDVSNSHMAETLEEMFQWNKYPTYDVYTQLLQHFQDSFPNLCRIDTILEDTPHPNLHHSIFAIHISNTLGQPTTKPAFLYSSTMHGWETVCYYMTLRLADYILNNAATDTAVQRLLDSVDLYICPLENPDGTYYLTNDLILKDGIHSIYHNYNDVQLNRNYPYLPGLEGAANIQPETQAIIDWVTPIHFVMSVNFHCGAEIVNYPWDAWTTQQRAHADADWFRYTGQNYASLCHAQDTAYLYGDYRGRSVIEGADWSPLVGGRQDYMTYYQRCREVTIEMSHIPVITDTLLLPTYWDKNKDALLSYAVESSYGFWGIVTDAETHEPIEAMVKVLNHDRFHSEVYSHLPLGVYHRPIMAGTYTVEVSAPCYQTATFTVTTRPGVGIRHDVELQPQVEAPVAFDQYILPGMQTTVVALATHEVHWYDSDTASQAIAVGDYFTTPVLYDTTTYYLEEQFQDDSLLCTSSRSSVTVYILGNTSVSEHNEDSGLKIFPNPTGDFLTIDVGSEPLCAVSVYDAEGKRVLTKRVSVSGVLDVTSIKPGSYLLRVEYADGCWCWAKFVKSGER